MKVAEKFFRTCSWEGVLGYLKIFKTIFCVINNSYKDNVRRYITICLNSYNLRGAIQEFYICLYEA